MQTNLLGTIVKPKAAILLVLLSLSGPVVAQQVSLALLQPESIEASPMVKVAEPVTFPEAPSHRFWDRKNTILFATSAAFSTADFVVTRNNLRNGGQEAAGVVAVSYLFHKTGHHKMERAVSFVNIGSSAGAVMFDLMH
jgi:hypothetical protein